MSNIDFDWLEFGKLEDKNRKIWLILVFTFERLDKVGGGMFLLVDVIHDGWEDWRLDLPHLGGTILFPNDFVESSKAATQGGVKMIFNVVIGAK